MKLTAQYIESMAKLSRLELTEMEKNAYAKELDEVFRYIDKLQQVNTDGVQPTDFIHVIQTIRYRKDEK